MEAVAYRGLLFSQELWVHSFYTETNGNHFLEIEQQNLRKVVNSEVPSL